MKKISFLILVLTSVWSLSAQPWNANIKTDQPGFYDYQKAFNEYWQGREPGKGEGYKPFKRWEWFWEPRVGLSGQFPPADINYTEWQKFVSNSKAYKASPVKTYWTFLGPTITPSGYNGLGRINCVTFHPTDSNTFWVGSAGGGAWKTTDFGKTWKVLADYYGALGVSSIVVNPRFTDSIYIATGDGDGGLSIWPGGDNKSIGVLLSSDGGLSWKPTGMNWALSEAKLITKLIMDPVNSKHLLFASSDGVYSTTDAGVSWQRKQGGHFKDIAFCPGNSQIVYAATYASGGYGAIYRSVNGGDNFTQTFTQKHANRITIGITKADPAKVQLLVSDADKSKFGGIYESIDSGSTFVLKTDTNSLNFLSGSYDGKGKSGQGWYDLAYTISPFDANKVFLGGVNLWNSLDGASTFKINTMWVSGTKSNPNKVQVTHADKHFLAYNPLNGFLFDCNDGGIYYSRNEGGSWTDISNGLGIMQFYRIGITEMDSNIIVAGAQDNGSKIRRGSTWYESTGGDGMHCTIDPTDPTVFYTGIQNGKIHRTDTGGTKTISDNVPNKPRGAWVTPYVIDPNDNNTLYAGFKAIYKSTDKGNTWVPICDSLWRPNYVLNIAVAPTNSQIIYASDYYKIYKTVNGGTSWSLVTSLGLPITCIIVHPQNPHVIYYTASSYSATSKVYRLNSLATGLDKIANITLNLPNVSANCIVYDKQSKEGLYVGTDVGAFYKDTSMGAWEPIVSNMPNVIVTDLHINYKSRLLFAGTFGRGIWKTSIKLDPKLMGPVIISIEPGDNSAKINPKSQLIIYFNEPVKKGSGIISIFETSVEKQKINVTSDSVVIEGNKVIITPAEYGLGKTQFVKFPKGTFLDLDNNEHKGIVANTEWNFTVITNTKVENILADNPVLISPNPTHGMVYIKPQPNIEIKSVSVYNSLGELMLTKNNQSYDCCELNLIQFSKGLYNIVIDINGKLVGQRIILK